MNSKFYAGDVLEFDDGMRAIVANVVPQATNSREYLYYLWNWYKGAIDWDSWSESELVDKVKIMDHIDISSLVGGEEEKEKEHLYDDAEELLQDLKNCIDPNYQCCDCPHKEDCDTGRDILMKEAIRVLGLLLEKKPVYEYDVEGKPIGKVINKEICDDGLKVTISTENVKEENKKLKKEIEAMKEALDRQKHDNDIWRQCWFDLLSECIRRMTYGYSDCN